MILTNCQSVMALPSSPTHPPQTSTNSSWTAMPTPSHHRMTTSTVVAHGLTTSSRQSRMRLLRSSWWHWLGRGREWAWRAWGHWHRPSLQPCHGAPPPHVARVLCCCHLYPWRLQGRVGPCGALCPHVLHGHRPPSRPARRHHRNGVAQGC